jgi:bifunctional non-homologous end joining protein LigD
LREVTSAEGLNLRCPTARLGAVGLHTGSMTTGPQREDLPRFIEPMLASAGAAPVGEEWAFEVKWDGARMQARWDGRTLSLRSRSGRACAEEFPDVQALGDALRGRQVVLDAELVCLGADGKPDFAALRARLGRRGERAVAGAGRRSPATLMVFDVLHLNARAVRGLPYLHRRELLAELGLDNGPAWRAPRHFLGCDGQALVAATAAQGLEGVIAKRVNAPYSAGRRSSAWLKHKHRRTERFVVTGWRERDGELPEFLLARRRGGNLIPAGSASLGLDAERRAVLLTALVGHELPARRRRGRTRWAAPVIEVSADFHGPVDGAVRDAVLREVALPRDS